MIKHWIISTLAILIAAYLLPSVDVTVLGAIVFAIVFAIINLFIKPVINLIALPINILTLGIFSLVINALLILLSAKVIDGFSVGGFWSAFFFGILLSLINIVFGIFDKKDKKEGILA